MNSDSLSHSMSLGGVLTDSSGVTLCADLGSQEFCRNNELSFNDVVATAAKLLEVIDRDAVAELPAVKSALAALRNLTVYSSEEANVLLLAILVYLALGDVIAACRHAEQLARTIPLNELARRIAAESEFPADNAGYTLPPVLRRRGFFEACCVLAVELTEITSTYDKREHLQLAIETMSAANSMDGKASFLLANAKCELAEYYYTKEDMKQAHDTIQSAFFELIHCRNAGEPRMRPLQTRMRFLEGDDAALSVCRYFALNAAVKNDDLIARIDSPQVRVLQWLDSNSVTDRAKVIAKCLLADFGAANSLSATEDEACDSLVLMLPSSQCIRSLSIADPLIVQTLVRESEPEGRRELLDSESERETQHLAGGKVLRQICKAYLKDPLLLTYSLFIVARNAAKHRLFGVAQNHLWDLFALLGLRIDGAAVSNATIARDAAVLIDRAVPYLPPIFPEPLPFAFRQCLLEMAVRIASQRNDKRSIVRLAKMSFAAAVSPPIRLRLELLSSLHRIKAPELFLNLGEQVTMDLVSISEGQCGDIWPGRPEAERMKLPLFGNFLPFSSFDNVLPTALQSDFLTSKSDLSTVPSVVGNTGIQPNVLLSHCSNSTSQMSLDDARTRFCVQSLQVVLACTTSLGSSGVIQGEELEARLSTLKKNALLCLCKLEPNCADWQCQLGNVYLSEHLNHQAEICFRDALRAQPHHWDAATNLGVLLFEAREFNQTYQLLKEARIYNAGRTPSLQILEKSAAAAEKSMPPFVEEARDLWLEITNKYPRHIVALYHLALLHFKPPLNSTSGTKAALLRLLRVADVTSGSGNFLEGCTSEKERLKYVDWSTLLLAEIYEKEGDFKALETLIQRSKNNMKAYNYFLCLQLLARIPRNDPTAARRTLLFASLEIFRGRPGTALASLLKLENSPDLADGIRCRMHQLLCLCHLRLSATADPSVALAAALAAASKAYDSNTLDTRSIVLFSICLGLNDNVDEGYKLLLTVSQGSPPLSHSGSQAGRLPEFSYVMAFLELLRRSFFNAITGFREMVAMKTDDSAQQNHMPLREYAKIFLVFALYLRETASGHLSDDILNNSAVGQEISSLLTGLFTQMPALQRLLVSIGEKSNAGVPQDELISWLRECEEMRKMIALGKFPPLHAAQWRQLCRIGAFYYKAEIASKVAELRQSNSMPAPSAESAARKHPEKVNNDFRPRIFREDDFLYAAAAAAAASTGSHGRKSSPAPTNFEYGQIRANNVRLVTKQLDGSMGARTLPRTLSAAQNTPGTFNCPSSDKIDSMPCFTAANRISRAPDQPMPQKPKRNPQVYPRQLVKPAGAGAYPNVTPTIATPASPSFLPRMIPSRAGISPGSISPQKLRPPSVPSTQFERQRSRQGDMPSPERHIKQQSKETHKRSANNEHFASLPPEFIIKLENLRLGRCLGTGGFGAVYSGEIIESGKKVAVKRLYATLQLMQQREWDDILSEIQAAIYLKHPNLVEFIGVCFEKHRLSLVTSLCSRGSLYNAIHGSGPPLPRVFHIRRKIAVDVTSGVVYLHTRQPKVVHRDLKSLNVVLNEDYKAMLCDFGLTTSMDVCKSHISLKPGAMGGSPRYMAPECFDSRARITEKVDVWALGCILLEIFGGGLPFKQYKDVPTIMNALLVRKESPLIPAGFPPDLVRILKGCFRQAPHDRWEATKLTASLYDICWRYPLLSMNVLLQILSKLKVLNIFQICGD